MYIEWKDEYRVGVAELDEGHKKLCALINELRTGILEGKGPDFTRKILKGLVGYSINHFADEERLMKEHGYPERLSHKLEHDDFRDKLLVYVDGYLKSATHDNMALLDFLSGWLENHLLCVDKKYQPFFISKGLT